MKWSFATIGVIILGIIGASIIILFQNITTNNENDYYLLKEITEAAMIDAIDVPYYRETGNLRIVKEKFVENFTRRFVESTVFVTNDYKIKFYDIIESPPKVSILIDTGLGEYTVGGSSDEYNIANKLDAILEYVGEKTYVPSTNPNYGNPYVQQKLIYTYYAIPGINDGSFSFVHSLKVPTVLIAPNVKNIKIADVKFAGNVETQEELSLALLQRELSFNIISSDFKSTNYLQDISEFSTTVSNINIDFYNCGSSTSKYKCDDVNKYFVSIAGNSGYDKSKTIFKYEVTWSYEEYEFID